MKNKSIVKCLLSVLLLLVCSSNIIADDMLVEQEIDPNFLFFTALSKCIPGDYMEKNTLAASVGQQFLNQKIIGEAEGMCLVKLTTPDNRAMSCSFPIKDLAKFEDPHILQGIVGSSADPSNKNSVNADELWSQMKANNCEF